VKRNGRGKVIKRQRYGGAARNGRQKRRRHAERGAGDPNATAARARRVSGNGKIIQTAGRRKPRKEAGARAAGKAGVLNEKTVTNGNGGRPQQSR